MPALQPDVDDRSLEELQLERLKRQLAYCQARSELYRRRFASVGFEPADVTSLDDFLRLDLTMSKQDEHESERESLERFGHPFGMHLCADPAQVVGISASSGTTGQPTFTYLFTNADLRRNEETWRRALTWIGVEPGEQILHTLGLSMWVVGTLAVRTLLNLSMRVLPVGAEAGPTRILEIAGRTRPGTLFATPTMAQRLIERSEEVFGAPVRELGIERLLCVGEPGAGLPEVRQALEQAFGARVYDAMLGAWGACQVSCDAPTYQGMHQLTPDLILWELVDVDTGAPIPQLEGARGRALVTNLMHEARPVVKFDTGDVCEIYTEPCACGDTHRRIRVLGRADEMLIVRGVNVYPSAVKDVVASFVPRLSGEVVIVLAQRPPRVDPPLRLRVELGPEAGCEPAELAGQLERRLRDLLRFRATVELVPARSLTRSSGKTCLIEVVDRGAAA